MFEPLKKRWRARREAKHFRKQTADLPDYLLRDIGLERDPTGEIVARHTYRSRD